MTPAEVAMVLTKAAAIDQRTIGKADVMAWHEILERVELADALEAVKRHYAEARDRIMPADVRRIARVVSDERKRVEVRHEVLALPSRFEDDPERDERNREGRARVQQVIHEILAKRNLDGTRAWEPSKLKGARGAWWEDVDARERHANRLLAEAGHLHRHCDDPACQSCRACPCRRTETA